MRSSSPGVTCLTWLQPLLSSLLTAIPRVSPAVAQKNSFLLTLVTLCILASNFQPAATDIAEAVEETGASSAGNPVNGIKHVNHPLKRTDIHVDIDLRPFNYLNETNYVPTKEPVNATAEIYDDRFRNASLIYQWSTKNKNKTITGPNATHVSIVFDKPDPDDHIKLLVVKDSNTTGTKLIKLNVRDPVVIGGPDGKLFLERGELLNITIPITGTGPFNYCFEICEPADSPDCDKCPSNTNFFPQTSDKIEVVKYLRRVGNYSLRVTANNIASKADRTYSVRIIESVRVPRVAWVPIVSSIMAVLILLSGVALHLKFRRTEFTETADFDFTRNAYDGEIYDDWDEEQSFRQRVRRLLFCRDEPQGSQWDSMHSNLSGSRTRLL